jgi:hypothetical protein
MVDIRDEEGVAEAVHEAADKSGGIDILINKASYPGGTASAPATTSTTLLPIPPTGIRADRRPLECCSGTADGTDHERNDDPRCRHQGASPPRLVALSERGSRVLVAGYSLPAHFVESTHKENLYGSSRSTFAAGVFGPAPIPTLKLSLVDCEI